MERAFSEPSESKLMLCGPKFYWFLTGEFDPSRPHFYRGNALQRRKVRRYRARMREAVGSLESYMEKRKEADFDLAYPPHPLFAT